MTTNQRTAENTELCVVQVSKLPPPVGGISVHTLRLHEHLLAENHDSRVLDFSDQRLEARLEHRISTVGKGIRGKLLTMLKYSSRLPARAVLHVHLARMLNFKWLAPFFFYFFRGHPTVVTLHSGNFVKSLDSWLGRITAKLVLSRFDFVICVSSSQAAFVQSLGINDKRTAVIPAFIQQQPDLTQVPAELQKANGMKKILVSGYLTELYNYDVLIDAIRSLSDRDGLFFFFAFYYVTDEQYESHILGRLEDLNNCHVFRDLSPEQFLATLSQCDIYVRPTTTDGDAVAVREALSLGLQVLASNAVNRPDACQLFDCNDSERLAHLISDSERGPSTDPSDPNFESILAIYNACVDS